MIDDPRITLVLLGFSPRERLAAVARHLGWTGLVVSDPGRVVYRALGLKRAPLWRVYTPRTLLTYAAAHRRGHRLRRLTEDTRQLGGDAVVVDGVVVTLWRPRSPDDRPSAAAVAAQALRRLAPGTEP